MKFWVRYDFISFLVLKIVIEWPQEIFKKLFTQTINLYDNS